MNTTEIVHTPRPEHRCLQVKAITRWRARTAGQRGYPGTEGGIQPFDVGRVEDTDLQHKDPDGIVAAVQRRAPCLRKGALTSDTAISSNPRKSVFAKARSSGKIGVWQKNKFDLTAVTNSPHPSFPPTPCHRQQQPHASHGWPPGHRRR